MNAPPGLDRLLVLAGALGALCFTTPTLAGDQARGPAAGASVVGGALPGGAVVSARSVAVAPASGGAIVGAPIADDGSFRVAGLAPGPYRLAITSITVPKQTQGATFGEKVQSGLAQAGSALAQGAAMTRHEAAKNAIGNVRAREAAPSTPGTTPAEASSAKLPDANTMPARISMNVTTGKRSRTVVVDDSIVDVEVGADGVLAGRVSPP